LHIVIYPIYPIIATIGDDMTPINIAASIGNSFDAED
jgi:hypothetical protein